MQFTFTLLQQLVELESRGAGSHSGLLQTHVTTLRVHAKGLVVGAGLRQDDAFVDI